MDKNELLGLPMTLRIKCRILNTFNKTMLRVRDTRFDTFNIQFGQDLTEKLR